MKRARLLRSSISRWSASLVTLALLCGGRDAEARPGGGSTYKSGSSYKSSGGSTYKSSGGSTYKSSSGSGNSGSTYKSSSGGGGSYNSGSSYGSSNTSSTSSGGSSSYVPPPSRTDRNVRLLFLLGLPAAAIVLYVILRNRPDDALDLGGVDDSGRPLEPPRASLPRKLEGLREHDPDFSVVVFEDFVYALYVATHEARGRQGLRELTPWLGQQVRGSLKSDPATLRRVHSIIVGAVHYIDVGWTDRRVQVRLRFEANYTEETVRTSGAVEELSYWTVDEWTFERATSARSRAPDKLRIWDCPSCGAPLDTMKNKTCGHCQQILDTGAYDWVVTKVANVEKGSRGPQLGGDTVEEGTDEPTLFDDRLQDGFVALRTKDPQFEASLFALRVHLIFTELQTAWSARDLRPVRGFLTDGLFQNFAYWIETYRKQHLRNVIENPTLSNVEPVRVTSDRWYDAITVRVHASSLDYTVDDTGRLVSGSKTHPRRYTEYWTLIRGASATGPTQTGKDCPKCGAALEIEESGNCHYCQAHVTAGEFDWVLSRIEQDEVYAG